MGVSIELPSRAARRRKIVARIYAGPGDKVGKRHTQKGARHNRRTTLFNSIHRIFHPSKDPSMTNHERVLMQRRRSGRVSQ